MAKEKVETTAVEEKAPEFVNPLRSASVFARHIPKQSGMFTDKKHVFYGGIADTSVKYFVPPLTKTGYKQILTAEESKYLEQALGMEEGSLSSHKKDNNFWNAAKNPAVNVKLGKEDVYFDLSDPIQYIQYKILLANNVKICPSVKDLQRSPKATYEFVLVNENEEIDDAKDKMNILMKCYTQYGKIDEDKYKMRKIIEFITTKPVDQESKLSWLQVKCNELIQAKPKVFLETITDPLLETKILISKCVDDKIIIRRGSQHFLASDNSPLCGHNEEPTLNVAAKYLNQPNHQDLKLLLESKVQQ